MSHPVSTLPRSQKVDYLRRWERLRGLMREQSMAALIVSENGRSRYLTGYQRYYSATHISPVHAVVLTQEAGPFLVVPRHIVLREDEHFAASVVHVPFGDDHRLDAIGEILRASGTAQQRIGIELGYLNRNLVDKLERRLPGAHLTEVEPLLRTATSRKFPDEIRLLREAARLVDEGVAAAVAACAVGVTELEVAARASARMLELGAEFINHMTIRSGHRVSGNFPFPTDRRFEDGECVQIDIGCIVGGYVSDTNRTVVVGRASADQEKLFDVGQRMLEAGVAAVRPGVRASEIWHAAYGVAERAGMADRVTLPYAGHGIGLSLHEEPFINAASTTILAEDMVFALEPGVYASGIGGSRPEDMILVTASGAELLTHFPRDADLHRSRR